ncbi:uncharacterized protein LOC123665741 [Melitaea cinxia]|uniref:uncharacterized protein LOC123665741 n=1 Tax=Melitaea cinxia TaxID=113334 RepID=UPI001E270C7A|nr:uncharacterized protein LOC123665741 [Melitaea cinxia]
MATIQIFNDFHCAGSIIKSDLIITASSCLQLAWNNRLFRENPAFLSVRVGSSFYSGGGEVIAVIEVYFHPGYNPKTLKNNICLLRLARQIKFRRKARKVKKIDFDRHDSNLPYNTPGITVVGWGAKEHSPVVGNPWKNIISYAVLDVYPLRDCQDIYSREYVTMKNFCAGFLSRGGGACNRDVGGPGIVDGKLMGVISFGSPVCGMPDSPTVFTKLGYYTDWIEEIIEQDVPVSKKRTTLKPTFNYEFITQTQPKLTTFKIAPITDKTMTPIPINQIDSLRVIDEKVFKEFLETMFNSKEVKDYRDIIKDDDALTVNKNDKNYRNEENLDETDSVTEAQYIEGPHTQILDVSDNENGRSSLNAAYTVLDKDNNPYTDEFEKKMSKIINNVDLERIIKEEVEYSSHAVNDKKKYVSKINGQNESINEYLSENENYFQMSNEEKAKDKDNEGLNIPDDIFEDLTRAKENETGVLPESVLYQLLSEVIRDEVENININTCVVFFSFVNLKYVSLKSKPFNFKVTLMVIIILLKGLNNEHNKNNPI